MTLQFSQAAIDDALPLVLSIAKQIDAEGLSASERANVAVTYVVENSDTPWPMSFQREILANATAALQADAPGSTAPTAEIPSAVPAPAPDPAPVPVRKAQAETGQLTTAATLSAPMPGEISPHMMTLANEVVQALSEILDFTDLAGQARPEQEKLIHDAIRALSEDRKMHLNGREVSDLVSAVLADMLGLGPLEALLADDRVTDIMVNGPHQVFVERLRQAGTDCCSVSRQCACVCRRQPYRCRCGAAH